VNLETRIKIEKRIAKTIAETALARGYMVSVHDGEEYSLKRSKNLKEIMAVLHSTDEDTFIFRNEAGERIGSVYLVYGNCGWDVICDHAANAETDSLLQPAFAIADKLCLQYA